jgi:hypothetical protein
MAGIITPQDVEKDKAARIAAAASAVTLADYNDTLEDYLKEVRVARGYTDRDPSEYYNSTVERWAQDARDWLAFRDRVMVYGLQVLTQYEQTGEAPCTLAEFDAHLREITIEWTNQED